ncbi:hypothetical protein AAIH70_21460 [Neorhizobium sp. BT27B]|uniref:hypothetical protein n=1 Tax=Neorhizobium sp. BT27B TaxID=3142625 RepID=UPI003D2D26E6
MSLVPDCGGLVEQLAIAIPAALLRSPAATDPCQPLIPIGKLIEAFPTDVRIVVMVDDACATEAQAWLDRLDLNAQIQLSPLNPSANAITSPWIQDGFHVKAPDPTVGRNQRYLAVSGDGPARHLARLTAAEVVAMGFHLDGGNQLVGSDFRLIGYSEIERIDAVRRLDHRPVSLFGYRVDDLGATAQPAGRIALSRSAATCPSPMHQFGYHIDQFVTLTGLYKNGRPLLVVGQPVPSDTPSPIVSTASRCLDASAIFLEEQGFAILRNPVAFAITPDTNKRQPRLYNNAIVENDIRVGQERPIVWLPQFSDFDALGDIDEANVNLWESLGFRIERVFGWTHLASRCGALRCISKVLLRKPSRELDTKNTHIA